MRGRWAPPPAEAYGHVTEELFILIFLLCDLVPARYGLALNICIPQQGGGETALQY